MSAERKLVNMATTRAAGSLLERVADLEGKNDALEQRLAAVESLLAHGVSDGSAPAAPPPPEESPLPDGVARVPR